MNRSISLLYGIIFSIQCSFAQHHVRLHFEWSNDSLNGEFFPKTSMHIPVVFDLDTTTYYFQLDTGSDQSYLYAYDSIIPQVSWINSSENELHSTLGPLSLEKLSTVKCYQENGRIHIGTLGADFFKGRIIEIDFRNQQIQFLTSYDSISYTLFPITLSYGRPIIRLNTSLGSYDFLLDTGSSLFELWTTPSIWKKLRDKSISEKSYPINSWGTINTAYRAPIKQEISPLIFNTIPVTEIWYNANQRFKKEFKTLNISGIVGNKPFLNQIILLDLTGEKMGIKLPFE